MAIDRTIRLAEAGALDMDVAPLVELRAPIHREVCDKGFAPVRNTFTRAYGSKELDAATLLVPRTGFPPPDEPRVLRTVTPYVVSSPRTTGSCTATGPAVRPPGWTT
ncbi:hypothetical protein SRO_0153 [Streptomyces rochei]|nr:hypothetical protein SRO_0153 [Streptomyces rochei]